MRKLALLAVAAMAALAFVAPPASAAPVEMEWHPTGLMCSTQPNARCAVHMNSEPVTVRVQVPPLPPVSFRCRMEVDLHIVNNGTLTFETEDLVDHPGGTGNCEDLEECDDPTNPANWNGSFFHTGAQENIILHFCIDPPLVSACEGNITGNVTHSQQGNEEGYEAHLVNATMFEGAIATKCDFSGEFVFENSGTTRPFEIHHL